MHDHTNNAIVSAVASVPSAGPVVEAKPPERIVEAKKPDRVTPGDLSRFFLTKKQMAELYHCDPKTIERRVDKGHLPKPEKNGGLLYWRRDQVYAAMKGEK